MSDAADMTAAGPRTRHEEPTGRGRVSRRRARARERLLAAAEEAFRTAPSYRDVRVEDLAEAADVSVGSIYTYFGSKDGLYLALAERSLELFDSYLDRAFEVSDSPLEQVLAAGDSYLRFHLEHPGSFRFLAFDTFDRSHSPSPGSVDQQLRDRVGGQLEQIIGRFQRRIEDALAAGEIDAGTDARLVARFLWGAWNGVVSFSRRGDRMALSDGDISACLQQGRRLVRDGLGAAGHRDEHGRARARLLDTAAPG